MERLEKIRDNWPLIALFVFYLYLAFHALSGNQGLMRWVDYEKDIQYNQKTLQALQLKRETLEAKVERLDVQHLDLDALDIQARKSLFVAQPDEYTIWLDPTP